MISVPTQHPFRHPWIAVSLILLLGAAGSILAQGPPDGGGRKAPPAPVVTAEVQTHALTASIQLPGSVKAPRKTQVAAPVAGLVKELLARDGDTVEGGQILARLYIDTLQTRRVTVEAQVLESEARRHAAEVRVRRAQELFEAKVISTEQLDDSRFELNALDAGVAALRASIGEIDLAIKQSTIKAPFSGSVTQKLTEIGQWVRVGDPLLEIIGTNDLEVDVDVPEIHFSKVSLGQACQIRFEALPGVTLQGKVVALAPEADPQARTFRVKVSVSSRKGTVRPGMVAAVIFAPTRPRTVKIVPKDALVEQVEGWVVFAVRADKSVAAVPIRIGESVSQWTEVSGDLNQGDQVVILGNERLRDGQSVNAQLRVMPKP